MTSFVRQIVEMGRTIEREGGPKFRVKRPTVATLPLAVERDYAADLLRIVDAIKADIDTILVPEISRIVRDAGVRGDSERADIEDIGAFVERLGQRIEARLNNQHLRDVERDVRAYFNATSLHQRRQLIRQIRRMLSVDAFPNDGPLRSLLTAFTRENVRLIQSLGGTYINEVTGIVTRGVQAGDRPTKIADGIDARWAVTRNKAVFIARDQTNKLNGALTQMRQRSLGVEKYIWRTSRDERVRNSHLEKEGRVFSWDDPPDDTGHPGFDFRCRCTAEPYIPEEPPAKENRREVIAKVKAKRKRLREELKGKPAARLIARDKDSPPSPATLARSREAQRKIVELQRRKFE